MLRYLSVNGVVLFPKLSMVNEAQRLKIKSDQIITNLQLSSLEEIDDMSLRRQIPSSERAEYRFSPAHCG